MIARYIRDIPDFPKPGIVYKDITPLLQSAEGLKHAIDGLAEAAGEYSFDVICGIESRGFIFGTALARQLNTGFIPIRKPGKLPAETASQSYDLEYGTDTLEIHTDAVSAGQRVLLVDDLLATGGTMQAAWSLIDRIGGIPVACLCVIELSFLPGRERLGQAPVHSLIQY